MDQKYLWRGVLIVGLSMLLAVPTEADNLSRDEHIVIAAIVVVAAAIVVVTVVVVHQVKSNRKITGCISSKEGGVSVTGEEDKRIYTLSGDTTNIKTGERVTLQIRKARPTGANKGMSMWEVRKQIRDLGACQP